MSDASHTPCADTTQADPGPGAAAPCPCCGLDAEAAAQAREHLDMLNRLARISMRMAERAERQMDEAKWLGADGPVMIDVIARSVRRTIALAMRLRAELANPTPPRAGGPRRVTHAPEPAPLAAVQADAAVDQRDPVLEADPDERLADPTDTMPGQMAGVVLAAIKHDQQRAEAMLDAKEAKAHPPVAEPPPPAAPVWDGMPVKGRGSFLLSDPNIEVQIGRETAGLPDDYAARLRATRGPP
jgi:hypothetical protein